MVNPVKVFKWKQVKGERHQERVEAGIGEFCQWGCNFEGFDTGVGNFSTAIVKMPDGVVENVPAEDIQFVIEVPAK